MRKIRRIIKWLTLLVILVYLVEPARASVPLALSLQAMESMRSTLIAVFLAEPAQAYVPPVQSARANCYYLNNKKRLRHAVSFLCYYSILCSRLPIFLLQPLRQSLFLSIPCPALSLTHVLSVSYAGYFFSDACHGCGSPRPAS